MRLPLALYIHIPFCASKCAYCDFASFPGREDAWARYLHTLKEEIRWWKTEGKLSDYETQTVFIGGGTPSLLPEEAIEEILENLRALTPFAPDGEITIEANPGSVNPEKLRAYKRAGVNRISFGAQSFDDDLLKSIGRIHSTAEIGEVVHMARSAGFDNINLDLMYALPGQSLRQWEQTIDSAVALKPEHISAYSLIVEPGTPMAARVQKGDAIIPDEDSVNTMQRLAVNRLAEAGYRRYEISNYAQAGRECRHNLTYWLRGEYLGFGCAAHSMLRNQRFANAASLEEYFNGGCRELMETLSRKDIMEETIMLSTRTCRGLDMAAWRNNFGEDFSEGREKIILQLKQAGLLKIKDGFLMLTTRGMEVQNAVVLELLGK